MEIRNNRNMLIKKREIIGTFEYAQVINELRPKFSNYCKGRKVKKRGHGKNREKRCRDFCGMIASL